MAFREVANLKQVHMMQLETTNAYPELRGLLSETLNIAFSNPLGQVITLIGAYMSFWT